MFDKKRECPQKNNCIAKEDGCYEEGEFCFWRDRDFEEEEDS